MKLLQEDVGNEVTVTGVWTQRVTAVDYPDEVNILRFLYTDYRRAERRHEAKHKNEED